MKKNFGNSRQDRRIERTYQGSWANLRRGCKLFVRDVIRAGGFPCTATIGGSTGELPVFCPVEHLTLRRIEGDAVSIRVVPVFGLLWRVEHELLEPVGKCSWL